MLFTLLAIAIMKLLSFFLLLLPAPEVLPEDINTSLTLLASYYPKINYMFPLDTMFQILGVVVAIELGFLTFKVFNYLLRAVRVIG